MFQSSPSHSLTLRLRFERRPGALARVASTIGENEALIGSIPIVRIEQEFVIRDFDIYTSDDSHEQKIIQAIKELPDVELLKITDRTFQYHEGGKIEINPTKRISRREELSMAYTPGVGRVASAIARRPEDAYAYTLKGSTVAIVSDGTAVLGLGDIGPLGALPVMEGKSMLFKEFAGINAFPICLNVRGIDEIVASVKAISPVFAAVNLEDISAPRCFEIERRLTEELDIPVFHDDQHGTSIAVLAALRNALKRVNKRLGDVRIVVSGIGAAGVACVNMLTEAGARDIICCDTSGALFAGRQENMNPVKEQIARITNPREIQGGLKDVLIGADVFIGVSSGNLLEPKDLSVMESNSIVFALSNPNPEVNPWLALDYAQIVATGRSDFPNQINNALVFPGLFKGVLDARARKITREMRLAAASAIASLIPDDELADQNIIPGIFNKNVCPAVASAVANAAAFSGGL